jgi:hypothetical protein
MPTHELQPDDQNDEERIAEEGVAHDDGPDVEEGESAEEEAKEDEEEQELAMS